VVGHHRETETTKAVGQFFGRPAGSSANEMTGRVGRTGVSGDMRQFHFL
jgi:hypothetical protein